MSVLAHAEQAASAPASREASAGTSVLTRDEQGSLVVNAIRVDRPITLDGQLDEAMYSRIEPASDFIQQEPREGHPATDRTETWVFFDDDALYVSARCWQPADVRMVANEMRRDSRNITENDNFAVILDTFRDGRNGFYFQTNPLGGLSDSYVTDESVNSRDWNTVWNVKTGRFDGGWTVEIKIPFKSLRYKAGRDQTWGVNFRRTVRARPEISFLVPIPASVGLRGLMRVSLAPPLVGLAAPPPALNLEIKPFGIATLQTDRTKEIPPKRFDPDGGFDLKFGVTKSLTFDFTYNTDFAQVEEDELQVNLTRFNLFFPEKREFFLEGQGIFSFGGAPGVGGGGGSGARRRPPNNTPVLFFSRRIGLVDNETVPIDVGARLSGKSGPWSVGMLDVQASDSVEAGTPATNFSVVRIKRDVLRRSAVGFIATGRSHNLDDTGANQVFGVDGNFAFYQNLSIVGFAAKSWSPDAKGDDVSYRGQFLYNGDKYGLELDQLYVGENFNPEIGFLRREDFRRWFAQARYSPRPASMPLVRKLWVEPSFEYFTNTRGALESRQVQVSTLVEFSNGDQWAVDVDRNTEVLFEPFEITDDISIPVDTYTFDNFETRYDLGPQRRISGTVSLGTGQFYEGTRRLLGWGGRVEVSSRLSIEPTFSINWVDLPQGKFTTNLVAARTNFSMSPRMQASALVQYNSGSDVALASVRFRWEYRPGSDLFVVYSEGRDTSVPGTPELSNRSFTVKLTRLFRF